MKKVTRRRKKERKKKYVCKVLNFNNIYNNCKIEKNYNLYRRQNCRNIVLKIGNLREENNPHRLSLFAPFKVGLCVVF